MTTFKCKERVNWLLQISSLKKKANAKISQRQINKNAFNCHFVHIAHHEWLLSDAVDILPYLLLPLAGPEELSEEENEGDAFKSSCGLCSPDPRTPK